MSDYADLIARLRQAAGGNEAAYVALSADAIESLQAECERLRAKVEVAEAGYQSAVSKAQWQVSTNSELNRLIRQRNELGVECDRLRAELAAARKAAAALTEIVRMPNAEHVADAHNAAVRLLKEKRDDPDKAFHDEIREIARETGTMEAVAFAERLIAAGVQRVQEKRDE